MIEDLPYARLKWLGGPGSRKKLDSYKEISARRQTWLDRSEGGKERAGRDEVQGEVGFNTKGKEKLYQSATAIIMLPNKSPQHSVA